MSSNRQKKKGPFKAYEGKKPYIFVSYKHIDSEIIYPILNDLNNLGFNIWYDDGLQYGEDYDDLIDLKIEESSLFVMCITENVIKYARKKGEYMKKELDVAIETERPIFPIFIHDVKLKGKYRMQLRGKHSLFKFEYGEKEFLKECSDAFQDDFGIEPNPNVVKTGVTPKKSPKVDDTSRLTSKYLKEFDKLNTTTESIFDLEDHDVLIILKDGTNLTAWKDVENKEDIVYVSEDLSNYTDLSRRYDCLKSLKAIVCSGVSDNVTNMDSMFAECSSLVDISSLSCWDTSQVTTMDEMFYRCSSLNDLSALSDWNTGQVTSMGGMFVRCSGLVSLSDLSGWDTGKVTIMEDMFYKCSNLKDASAISKWDTSQVTLADDMFYGCSSLEEVPAASNLNTEVKTPKFKNIPKKPVNKLDSEYLKEFDKLNNTTESIFDLKDYNVLIILKDGTNLTNWEDVENKDEIIYVSEDLSNYADLSRKYAGLKSLKAIVASGVSDNVTNMDSMFQGCSKLADISNLFNWDVSQVTNMMWMFDGCSGLVDVSGLSGWDTGSVTSMELMFDGCSGLVDVSGLSGWDISQVTTMRSMFNGCSGLVDVSALSGWDTGSVTSMDGMFFGCSGLVDVSGLSGWDTGSVTSMESMFKDCSGLVDVSPLSDWDTSQVTTMQSMFKMCPNLVDVSALSSWDTSQVTTMQSMFDDCSGLADVSALSNWNVGRVTNMWIMFYRCSCLVDISALSGWDTSQVTTMQGMFASSGLVDVSALSNWDTGKVTTMESMFDRCPDLVDVSALSGWDTSNVIILESLFEGCSSLTNISGLSGWDIGQVTNMKLMFKDCSSLVDVSALSGWDMDHVSNKEDMFKGCSSLEDSNASVEKPKGNRILKKPSSPYSGDEPYIFVSYSHRDADKVFPDLKKFNELGYNIWYDEGLGLGSGWLDEVENALLNCSVYVVFLSSNSVESKMIRNEFNLARSENKPIIPIYLEETELKYGLRLILGSIQGIFKYGMSEENYIEACDKYLRQFLI